MSTNYSVPQAKRKYSDLTNNINIDSIKQIHFNKQTNDKNVDFLGDGSDLLEIYNLISQISLNNNGSNNLGSKEIIDILNRNCSNDLITIRESEETHSFIKTKKYIKKYN